MKRVYALIPILIVLFLVPFVYAQTWERVSDKFSINPDLELGTPGHSCIDGDERPGNGGINVNVASSATIFVNENGERTNKVEKNADPSEYGTHYLIYAKGNDICNGPKGHVEHRCKTEDGLVSVEMSYLPCADGQLCRNGACVQEGISQTSDVIATCTDSDGGRNLFVKGDVSGIDLGGSPYTTEDICTGEYGYYNTGLWEMICSEASQKYGIQPYLPIEVNCSNGCSNGACIQEPTETGYSPQGGPWQVASTTPANVDAENIVSCSAPKGDNPSKAGEAIFVYLENGKQTTRTDKDECNGNMLLDKFTCNQNNNLLMNSIKCGNGCKDGVCLTDSEPSSNLPDRVSTESITEWGEDYSSPGCRDTDGGINTRLKGSITGKYGDIDYREDTCEDSQMLTEYFCGSRWEGGSHPKYRGTAYFGKSTRVECSYGCENGACKSPSETTHSNRCSNPGGDIKDKICDDAGVNVKECGWPTDVVGLEWEPQWKVKTCLSRVCVDGKCIGEPTWTGCVDSDGGNNKNKRGTVAATYQTKDESSPGIETQTDKCESDKVLREYECGGYQDENRNKILDTLQDCSNCKDGACVKTGIIDWILEGVRGLTQGIGELFNQNAGSQKPLGETTYEHSSNKSETNLLDDPTAKCADDKGNHYNVGDKILRKDTCQGGLFWPFVWDTTCCSEYECVKTYSYPGVLGISDSPNYIWRARKISWDGPNSECPGSEDRYTVNYDTSKEDGVIVERYKLVDLGSGVSDTRGKEFKN